MFAKRLDGSALCIADYKDIKTGAIVPASNELFVQVTESVELSGWQDLPPPPEPTAEELASIAKQTGEVYADTDITVPFTNEVANGLMQIKNGFDAAKDLVAVGAMSQADYDALSANLEINKEVKLHLTPATILPFSAWFWTKRSAFF